jgi:transposase
LEEIVSDIQKQSIPRHGKLAVVASSFCLVAPVGRNGLAQLITVIGDPDNDRIPDEARASLALLVSQLNLVNEQILETDRRVRTGSAGA